MTTQWEAEELQAQAQERHRLNVFLTYYTQHLSHEEVVQMITAWMSIDQLWACTDLQQRRRLGYGLLSGLPR